MTRPKNNMRIVSSDSEPDRDRNSDHFTDDANATERSPSHLGSNTKRSIGLSDTFGKSDDDTSSATIKKRDSSHRHLTIPPETDTQCPIGGLKSAKRTTDTRGIDPHNIMPSSPLASSDLDLSQDQGESPAKRPRLMRGNGRNPVNYDMKHHPMDDVLRPKYSAKRRAKGRQVPEESSENGSETSEAARRRSSRNTHRSETPIYSAKWHPVDQALKNSASSMSVSNKDGHSKKICKKSNDSSSTLNEEENPMVVDSDLEPDQDGVRVRAPELGCETVSISPDRRRSARVSSSKDTPPNYDMKYHVMDSALRPRAATKRLKSKLYSATSSEISTKSPSSMKLPTKELAKASRKVSKKGSVSPGSKLDLLVTPALSQLQNPYLNRNSLGWTEVQQIDRCMYLLQKGAPLYGNTLPQSWTDVVKKVLSDEGITTFDELNSREGIEILKARYENVRLGLQNSFDSKFEPVNRDDWTLANAEGFDVYDMERGSRYWKHQRNSIVEGIKTTSSSKLLRFAPGMVENIAENDGQQATESLSEERVIHEAKVVKKKGTNLSSPKLKRPPAAQFDTERTTVVDREDDGELGVIIETEDTLIESMRGEHVPSSIMSIAMLEELLFPNELSSVASEAKATNLNTSSDRGLAGIVSLGKEETEPSANVGRRDRSGEPQTPKADVKIKKRKSRVGIAIAVHEDLPGRTPLVKKIVSMNPASPGTDIPKENLEADGSMEHSSQVEMRTPRTLQRSEAIGTLSTRRVRHHRPGSATSATPPYQSLFGSPLGSSFSATR